LFPDERLPDPNSYTVCVAIAADVLSRVMEKVFLNRFGCTEFDFYTRARYNSAWAP
jgi:hypothetical protein